MESKSINKSLNKNITALKNKIGQSFDIVYRHFRIPVLDDAEAFLVYISGITDTRAIDDTILAPLMKKSPTPEKKTFFRVMNRICELMEHHVFTSSIEETRSWNDICDAVVEGNAVLFVDECDIALIHNTMKFEGRSVDEPDVENEIRAPREGFVENIQTNMALIRRRIKDYSLRFDKMTIGLKSKTVVSIVYIEGLVEEKLLNEVKERIDRIRIDAILETSYIEELIEDAPNSLFPQIANTERPDKVCSFLLEGRIAILADNTPFALIIPSTFWQFLTSSGDYYERRFYSTFIRWVRVIALFLTISASSIFVLVTSYHQEMLPTALALKIAAGRNGLPFPTVVEAFLMEIVMEIMKEAGLRVPTKIGQAVSIVGTLVIGQAAVEAGLVGPATVIVIAIAAISSFAIPSYSMSNTLRLVRFPVLFLTSLFGLLGYLAAIMALLLHLMSLRSFGTQYLAPLVPFGKSAFQDAVVRAPWWKMFQRPDFVNPDNNVRQETDQKPEPPPKKQYSGRKKNK